MAGWCLTQLYLGVWVSDLDRTRREALDLARRAFKASADNPDLLALASRRGIINPVSAHRRTECSVLPKTPIHQP
jgi:hypothetical protein